MTNMDLQKFLENPKTAYLAGEYKKLETQQTETQEMLSGDPAMAELAKGELEDLKLQKDALWSQMQKITEEEEKEEEFPNEIILEVRAGAGGEEAALFAKMLADMYQAYAVLQGWGTRALEESKTALDGYKQATFEFRGLDVYKKLRYETGVHRIQRVPETEKMGRPGLREEAGGPVQAHRTGLRGDRPPRAGLPIPHGPHLHLEPGGPAGPHRGGRHHLPEGHDGLL